MGLCQSQPDAGLQGQHAGHFTNLGIEGLREQARQPANNCSCNLHCPGSGNLALSMVWKGTSDDLHLPRSQANRIFSERNAAFAASRECYTAGDHAGAKAWSSRGKALDAQGKALNRTIGGCREAYLTGTIAMRKGRGAPMGRPKPGLSTCHYTSACHYNAWQDNLDER
jgi:hypothetical protein